MLTIYFTSKMLALLLFIALFHHQLYCPSFSFNNLFLLNFTWIIFQETRRLPKCFALVWEVKNICALVNQGEAEKSIGIQMHSLFM